MSLNYVTLTGTLPGADGATATFSPSGWLTDSTDDLLIPPRLLPVTLAEGGTFTVKLLATDNSAPVPSGWTWQVTITGIPGVAAETFSFLLPYASGAVQDISTVATVLPAAAATAVMPLPSGTASAGKVPVATGSGEASAWGSVAVIDGTAGDIQPLGAAAAAGSVGKAADAGHVHPDTGVAMLAGDTFTGYVAPAVAALTQSGGLVAVNAALGNVFALTLTASTWTISNPTNPVDGQIIRIRLVQDTTGSRTVSWGTAYDWGSGSAPTLTTTANKVDMLAFEYVATTVNGSPLNKWVYLGAAFPQGF